MAVAAALDHSANKKSLLEKEVVKGDAQHLTGPEDSCRGAAWASHRSQRRRGGLRHRAWALVVLLLWRCRQWRLLLVTPWTLRPSSSSVKRPCLRRLSWTRGRQRRRRRRRWRGARRCMRRCSTKLQLRWRKRGSCWSGTRGRGRRGGSGSFSSFLSLGSTAGTSTCVSLRGGSGGDSRNDYTGGYSSGHPAVLSVSQVSCLLHL